MAKKEYSAGNIKVLEGLEAVRKRVDVSGIFRLVKRKGDVERLAHQFGVRPRIFNSLFYESRILSFFPGLEKSKAGALAPLRTQRDLLKFSKIYDPKIYSTRQLILLVRKWNSEIQKNPLLILKPEEHEMIIGTLMGDASVRHRGTNSILRFSHSVRQKEYLLYKKNMLAIFNFSEFNERSRENKYRIINSIDFSTRSHPVFNYYRFLFYGPNGKEITMDILNQITPRSLAFWICDDGSYCKKQKYIILCTNSFSIKEHQLMKTFFLKKYGLDPSIGFRDGKYYYLRFSKSDTRKLCEMVKEFVPSFMRYKIGEEGFDG